MKTNGWFQGLIGCRAIAGMPLTLAGGSAQASSVAVTIMGASEPWMASDAASAARSVFQKQGFQVLEGGSKADLVATITIEFEGVHRQPLTGEQARRPAPVTH